MHTINIYIYLKFREFLIIFKKIILIDMQLFNINMQQKAHFLLFMTLSSTYLTIISEPFNDYGLNYINNLSNLSSSLVLFCGCLYLFDVNEFVKPLLYILIILINAIFVARIGKNLIKIAFSLLKNRKIKSFFSRMFLRYDTMTTNISFSKKISSFFQEIKRKIFGSGAKNQAQKFSNDLNPFDI